MRLQFLSALSVITLLGMSESFAQSAPPGDVDTRREVSALREAVIQQTRQIDALTTEIERLGVAMGQRRPSKSTDTPAATVSPSATPPIATMPAATSTPTPIDPNTVQHTVTKGENLTIISKKYGVTVDAIQKLNKITDVRKMQVGQILAIPLPSPAHKANPASSATVSPSK